jgi:hypothetical protein
LTPSWEFVVFVIVVVDEVKPSHRQVCGLSFLSTDIYVNVTFELYDTRLTKENNYIQQTTLVSTIIITPKSERE